MPSPDTEKADGEGDSPTTTDWGEIFGEIVCHTSIVHGEIPYLTLPQLDAYRASIGRSIPLKVGMPSIFGGSVDRTDTSNEEPNQEDVDGFFSGF